MAEACAWRIANPDNPHGGHGTNCWGWSCRSDPKKCDRKKGAASKRKAETSAYRKFPGNDLEQARTARRQAMIAEMGGPKLREEQWAIIRSTCSLGSGRCKWCEGEILKPGGAEVNLRRGWHDGRGDEPDCLGTYYAHTRSPDQLAAIIARDGTRCACCGEEKGSWYARDFDPARVRSWGPSWAARYPEDVYVAPFISIERQAALEADHVLALRLVVLTIPPAEQWRYWGPMNLQGLCARCHSDKTARDVRRIRETLAMAALPEPI